MSEIEKIEECKIKTPEKKQGYFRRLYCWTMKWSNTKHAEAALLGIAFAESSFFPIPPDVFL